MGTGTDEGSGGPAAGPDMQFDKVEHAAPAAPPTCGRCQRVIDDEYFEVAGHLFCRPCSAVLDGGKGARAFFRAFGLGAGAALIGTLVWFAIVKLTNMEFGLVAIAVGLFVGFAVRKGARGLGGWKYQALAMTLTYMSITASNVPLIIKELATMNDKQDKQDKQDGAAETQAGKDNPAAAEGPAKGAAADPAKADGSAPAVGFGGFVVAFMVLLGFAFAAPFLAGAENIMGLIIIAIALYEAWKINKRIPIAGPFRLGAPPVAFGAPGPTPPAPSPT